MNSPYYYPNYYEQEIQRLQNLQQQLQPPVQNVINTTAKVDIECKFLNGEDITNMIVTNRTLFVDEANQFIALKEPDGTISKRYTLIIPKDEKEIEIDELKSKLEQSNSMCNSLAEKINEMEMKLNAKFECAKPDIECKQSDASNNELIKSTTKKSSK